MTDLPSDAVAPRYLFVGNDRGGCGKTFATCAIAVLATVFGHKFQLVEYEAQPRLESMLAGFVPVEFRHSKVDRADASQSFESVVGFWDTLSNKDFHSQQTYLYDTAANLLSDALSAIGPTLRRDKALARGENFGFVVPTTVESFALAATPDVVRLILKTAKKSRVWIVENERDGPFFNLPGFYESFRQEMVDDPRVSFVRIPRMPIAITNSALSSVRLDLMLSMSADDIMAKFGTSRAAAYRQTDLLRMFAVEIVQAVVPMASWLTGNPIDVTPLVDAVKKELDQDED